VAADATYRDNSPKLPNTTPPPGEPSQDIFLKHIDFTYYHDKYPKHYNPTKIDKYTTVFKRNSRSMAEGSLIITLTMGQQEKYI
jgi:hypothetical protein